MQTTDGIRSALTYAPINYAHQQMLKTDDDGLLESPADSSADSTLVTIESYE